MKSGLNHQSGLNFVVISVLCNVYSATFCQAAGSRQILADKVVPQLTVIENNTTVMGDGDWSIESKAEVISSKVDVVSAEINNDFRETWTVLQTIVNENWSIESKAEVISSKIDALPRDTAELWSIESKAEVISSKIDTLPGQLTPELWSIESKAEVISSKIDALPRDTAELWSIESKAEVISSKIDTLPGQLTPELWSIESKAEVISSKIDALPRDTAELWSIESKAEVISSKIDTLPGQLTPELWSIESKAEVISSKIDTLPGQITPELWSIESKAEVISSKIDALPRDTAELWSIESKAEVISSKIDLPLACAATPIAKSGTTASNKTPISGAVTLSDSGDYCLNADLSGDIVISGNNISLDLNGYTVNGSSNGIDIRGTKVDVFNGTIQNSANTGVKLSTPYCTLSSLDVVNTKTGYQLINADYAAVNNCRALACTMAGFSLEQSEYATLTSCQAVNTGSSIDSVSGFVSNGGLANTFDGCVAKKIYNTNVLGTASAHGFKLYNSEQKTTITNSTANDIKATGTSVYGVYLESTITSTLSDVAWTQTSDNANAIAWLKRGSNPSYVATADFTNPAINILRYDGTTLTSVNSLPSPAASLAWTTMGEKNYLALASGSSVYVYEFIPASNALDLVTSATLGNHATAVAWLEWGNNRYLAAGASTGDILASVISIFPFSGTAFGTVIPVLSDANSSSNGLDFIVIGNQAYLAASYSIGTYYYITIYEFTGTSASGILSVLTTNGADVKWLQANNGRYYVINSNGSPAYLAVSEFIQNPATLTVKATSGSLSSTQFFCSCFPCNQHNYIAAGTYGLGAVVKIFDYDGGTTLSEITTYEDYDAISAQGVDWFGPNLAVATQGSTYNNHILTFSPAVQGCAVTGTTVRNVNGTGFYGDTSSTVFMDNIVYNAMINYNEIPSSANNNRSYVNP